MQNLYLTFVLYVVPVKSKVKISQNYVAFSEYMNFNGSQKIDIYKIPNIMINFRKTCAIWIQTIELKEYN